MNEKNKIFMRKVIGGLGLGLASLTTSPIFASNNNYYTTQAFEDLKDPTTKFHRPSFKAQCFKINVSLVFSRYMNFEKQSFNFLFILIFKKSLAGKLCKSFDESCNNFIQ